MKPCCFCKKEKSLTEFYRSSRTKDGRQTQCIECDRARKKKPEERERDRLYHQKNKEKRNEYFRQYRKDNPEKAAKTRQDYYQRNKEWLSEYQKIYFEKYSSSYNGMLKIKANKARRKSKYYDVRDDGTVNQENLNALADFQKKCCANCPAILFDNSSETHLDHIVPLSAGGANSIFNVQWLCAACNLRKGSKVYALYPQRITVQFGHMLSQGYKGHKGHKTSVLE